VVLTSPATLFAVLAVVRHTADRLALAETGDEILAALAGFRDQWERTAEVVDRLGRGLQTTRRAFEELNGVRDQQLRRHLDRIDELRQGRGMADPLADRAPRDGDVTDAEADGDPVVDADADPATHADRHRA
jgi:DNA recombination protein RmuC